MPVFNEETDLPKNLPVLVEFMRKNMGKYDWEIVVADNASTDKTGDIAKGLGREYPEVKYLSLPQKGRGRALKKAWDASGGELLSYMDVDLSSDISFFPKLISSLEDADVSIGSRLKKGAKVIGRPPLREVMSRGYSFLFRSLFLTSFKDAQCGFKAIRRSAWERLSPLISDTGWFFDSELLINADKSGMKIAEVPIVWKDDPRSTVKVAKTAWGDIKGLLRLFVHRPWKKLKK